MQSLAAHNAARRELAQARREHPRSVGVACPECPGSPGVPMELANPVMLIGDHDGASVQCPQCGHQAVMLL